MRLDLYSPQIKNQTLIRTDVVITNDSIEVHNYSPDPRERHLFSKHSSTKQFLSVFIKQRIDWAVIHLAGFSPAAGKLNAQSDYETFKNVATEFGNERRNLTEQYHLALERSLNGIFVKLVSKIIGF